MMNKIIPSNMKNIVTKSVVARKLKTAFFILVLTLTSNIVFAQQPASSFSYDKCTGLVTANV